MPYRSLQYSGENLGATVVGAPVADAKDRLLFRLDEEDDEIVLLLPNESSSLFD